VTIEEPIDAVKKIFHIFIHHIYHIIISNIIIYRSRGLLGHLYRQARQDAPAVDSTFESALCSILIFDVVAYRSSV
jgi:hypothetical protein